MITNFENLTPAEWFILVVVTGVAFLFGMIMKENMDDEE